MITQYPPALRQPVTTTIIPPGGKVFRRYARNGTIGTVYEMIDATGASSPQYRTTAARIELRSTDAADTFLGTGARTVNVRGLNATFDEVIETVQLAGTATVTTTTPFIRIVALEVGSAGVYGGLPGGGGVDGANIGTITANYLGTPAVVCTMRPQDGREFSAAVCVPNGYYCGLTGLTVTVDSGKTCDIMLQYRDNADIVAAPFPPVILAAELLGVSSGISNAYNPEMILPPKTDLYIMGRATQTSAISFTLIGYFVPI